MSRTDWPRWAREAARFTAAVVLPVPPLKMEIARTLATATSLAVLGLGGLAPLFVFGDGDAPGFAHETGVGEEVAPDPTGDRGWVHPLDAGQFLGGNVVFHALQNYDCTLCKRWSRR